MLPATTKTTIWPIVIATLVGLLSYLTFDNYFSRTLGRLTLEGKFPADTRIEVRSINLFGGVTSEWIEMGKDPLNVVKRAGTKRMNLPVDELHLKIQVTEEQLRAGNDVINPYQMQFIQPYSGVRLIPKNQIPSVFESEQFFGIGNSFIKVDSKTGIANLKLRSPLAAANPVWALWPSFFLALLVWLVARAHDFKQLPAFSDMSLGRKISSSHEFDTINGIRGLAALLVLFSHTAPGFEANNVGIALLFVVSGFLLSKPFVADAGRIKSWDAVESYLLKRVKRILPMYYFFIFITYVLSFQFDTALRNFLFVEASGHLWPMTQIFTFYMCLPLVLLLTSRLWLVHRLLPVFALLLGAAFWLHYMVDWKPYYNGQFFKEFYLYAFLLGVAGSYLQFDLLPHGVESKRLRTILSIVLLLITVGTIAWSAPLPPPRWLLPFMSQFYAKCILALAIIILALQAQGTWINRLLANPLFRSIGVVGFSFYLLHGLGMELALSMQETVFGIESPADRSWTLMGMALVLTYLMSLFTYSYIERPFFGYRNKAA